jgi:uncharacterized RDD family membrane protein YckC
MSASARLCVRCKQPLAEGLFCQFDGVYVLDPEGTVVMAGRGERLLAWLVNLLIGLFTLFIGWIIWWFIVAPRGQNPGKAVIGIRVIQKNGDAVRTGGMFVRGLVGIVIGLIVPFPFSLLDDLWLLWDRDAQTLHDKLVNTVVVKAKGSEKIVEKGGIGALPEGVVPPPVYAPPIRLTSSAPPAAETAEQALQRLADLRQKDLISEEEYQEKRRAIIEKL